MKKTIFLTILFCLCTSLGRGQQVQTWRDTWGVRAVFVDNGYAIIGDSLRIGGPTTINGKVVVRDSLRVGSNAVVNGTLNVSGNLTAGNISTATTTASGKWVVTDSLRVGNDAMVNGKIAVRDSIRAQAIIFPATQGDLLVATSANTVGNITAVAAGKQFVSNGASAVPVYAKRDTIFAVGASPADSNSTGSLVNAPDFHVYIAASETWYFEFTLDFATNANSSTNGLKVAITVPTSATLHASVFGQTSSATAYSNEVLTTSGTASAAYVSSSVTTSLVRIIGVVTNSTTPGNIQLQIESGAAAKLITINQGATGFAYRMR